MNNNNYLNEKSIKDALAAGMTEEEITKKIVNTVSSTFEDYRNEKAKQEKAEKERTAQKEKVASLRNKLTDIIIEYLTALGYTIKGDMRSLIDKKLKLVETRDYPYPFINWDDIFNIFRL